ncbi:MAG TPA: hypothetical protein DCG19_10680 [Cryomorphaceae bacterium]|nr:hypothetical protein [Owenweeksia sp.]MBF99112.1 hypothetical protein [Owenweeksia sp.]HAD97862.1 hypothetical protein [Cryomorphaceae bacterium]HBF20822.1 hypothetical protein [Cryomorphaceae bacterium]|tara:strand:+ start:20064 stop:20555 length:492 start_codon:yes stop_codon:yes gene_type:complete
MKPKPVKLKVLIRPKTSSGGYPLIEVPPGIADNFLGSSNKKRMVVTFANGWQAHRALQRSKNGETFILLGGKTLKEAGLILGDETQLTLQEDTSKYGMPMPEEFQEVLNQDEEGRQLFEQLKPGLQRSFLYYINTAKMVDTRINRSLQLIERLKTGDLSRGNQ